jgi:uncharacterized protein
MSPPEHSETSRAGPSARSLSQAARPRSRHAHWQAFGDRGQLLVVNGSRLFDVDTDVLEEFNSAVIHGDAAVEDVLRRLNLLDPPLIDDTPPVSPPLRALSLAVAQKCNLGCTYCYASQGEFGGQAKNMPKETARQAIELLFDRVTPGTRLNLAFLGGEPLANRVVIRDATEFAAKLAGERRATVGFSLTTNGTLVTEDDAAFFEDHGFAVTVSLDGLRDDQDRQRPFKNGRGSFDVILTKIQPLLSRQKRMQVSVRSTITPSCRHLREGLEFFLDLGFHSVGFSPVLRSPTGQGEFAPQDYASLLEAMVDCGIQFERHVIGGERYAFANIVNALHEIHRGTHRPYPCGAGAGYLGVSADGDLAACHRFVGDAEGGMGTVAEGVDQARQAQWLSSRHVHNQSPCHSCWARYLCSGGCHHEVIARGRPACDFIRGWLHYCLQAYGRLSKLRPDWFGETASEGTDA